MTIARATEMKVGPGLRKDVKLCAAVASGAAGRGDFMVDANHCYTTLDAHWRNSVPVGSRSWSRPRTSTATGSCARARG